MAPKKKGLPKKSNKVSNYAVLDNLTIEKDDKWYNLEGSYNPYMINKMCSMNIDSLGLAERAARFCSDLPKKMHYDFYRLALPKRKIFFNYIKKQDNKDVLMVANFYGVNEQVAKRYISILTNEQLEDIRSKKDHIKDNSW
jgi:late competence protein required for DNA uptake (superfamily II DNA/RNA helicase)